MKLLDCQTNKTVNIWYIWKLFVVMATNHSMDQDTRVSHSKAQEAQAFWSICPKLQTFGMLWRTSCWTENRYFAKKKQNKTKENKKKRWKENSQVDLLWQRPAGLMVNFYLYHINLTWPFSDIFNDGINGQTWKVFLSPINIQSSYLN